MVSGGEAGVKSHLKLADGCFLDHLCWFGVSGAIWCRFGDPNQKSGLCKEMCVQTLIILSVDHPVCQTLFERGQNCYVRYVFGWSGEQPLPRVGLWQNSGRFCTGEPQKKSALVPMFVLKPLPLCMHLHDSGLFCDSQSIPFFMPSRCARNQNCQPNFQAARDPPGVPFDYTRGYCVFCGGV